MNIDPPPAKRDRQAGEGVDAGTLRDLPPPSFSRRSPSASPAMRRRISEAQQCAARRSSSELVARQIFIAEAKSWLGTPFRDQADVKGGGVDCAMLLVRAATDTGLISLPADDPRWPRPYAPQWHLHRSEEKFLDIVSQLGAEVDRAPIPGDVMVYRVGRCFSHGGIIIENNHVLHAYYKTQNVTISPLHDSELAFLPDGKPRPFKLFDLWGK